LVVLLIGLSVYGVIDWYLSPSIDDWRAATTSVVHRARRGDGAVFCEPWIRQSMEHYLVGRRAADRIISLSPKGKWHAGLDEQSGAVQGVWPNRIWIVRAYQSDEARAARNPGCGLAQRLAGYDIVSDSHFHNVRLQLAERHAAPEKARLHSGKSAPRRGPKI